MRCCVISLLDMMWHDVIVHDVLPIHANLAIISFTVSALSDERQHNERIVWADYCWCGYVAAVAAVAAFDKDCSLFK